jgi:tetratricopeptide (TPR) repeat protein
MAAAHKEGMAAARLWPAALLLFAMAAGALAQTPPATAPTATAPATAPAATPSVQDQIDQGIGDLSASDWRVREKAVNTLWSIGPLASARLMEAARSKDPEVAARATEILDKFAAGIYSDTPREVTPLLQQYRAGKAQLAEVVARLQTLGPAGYKTMAIVAPQELHRTLYALVADDEMDKARELLAAVRETGSDASLSDLSAVYALTGQLDSEIDRLAKTTRSGLTEKCLAYLYRAKGDRKSALDCARRSQDQELLKDLLIEQADWKSLAQVEAAAPAPQGPEQELAIVNHLGHLAAYQRLAGSAKESDAAVEALIQLANSNAAMSPLVAKSLLINERPAEALALLRGRTGNPNMAAAMLMQLGRPDEAIATLEKFHGQGDETQLSFTLATMNVQAGHRQRAWELLNNMFLQLRYSPDGAKRIILQECRLGFRKQAMEQMPQMAPWRGGTQADFSDILGPVLAQPDTVVRTWYGQFREPPQPGAQPWGQDPNAAKCIASLLALFDHQTPAKTVDAAIAKLEKATAADSPPGVQAENFEAIGGLLAFHGRKAEALKYYQKAADVAFPADQPEPAELVFERTMRAADLSAETGKWEQAAADYALAFKAGPKKLEPPAPPQAPNPMPLRRRGQPVVVNHDVSAQETWTALYLQGCSLLKAGKPEEGQKAIARASLMFLGDAKSRLELAQTLEKQKFDGPAAAQLDLVARTAELGSLPWYNQWAQAARRLAAKKDFAAAAAARQRYSLCCLTPATEKVQFDGYLIDACLTHADSMRACLADGKFDEAVRQAQKVQALLPTDTDALMDLIPALDKAGKKDQADKLFDPAFQQELARVGRAPDSSSYQNGLAWLCARCRRQLDAGLEHALKAVDLEKNSPGLMDTLAEVYFQRGDRDKAVQTMTAALALQPNWDYLQKQLARMKSGKPQDPLPEAGEQP